MQEETKSLVFKIILVLLVILLLAFAGYVIYRYASTEEYTFKKDGISIRYPKKWTIKEYNQPDTLFSIISPKEDDFDEFQENLTLTTKDLTDMPMSVEEFADTAIFQMKAVFPDVIEDDRLQVDVGS